MEPPWRIRWRARSRPPTSEPISSRNAANSCSSGPSTYDRVRSVALSSTSSFLSMPTNRIPTTSANRSSLIHPAPQDVDPRRPPGHETQTLASLDHYGIKPPRSRASCDRNLRRRGRRQQSVAQSDVRRIFPANPPDTGICRAPRPISTAGITSDFRCSTDECRLVRRTRPQSRREAAVARSARNRFRTGRRHRPGRFAGQRPQDRRSRWPRECPMRVLPAPRQRLVCRRSTSPRLHRRCPSEVVSESAGFELLQHQHRVQPTVAATAQTEDVAFCRGSSDRAEL